jgi:UDP-GlcNAc:undecaprenyl-phosphate/decaprenyl-phosphate GlcNAc-1-phosphate transferase
MSTFLISFIVALLGTFFLLRYCNLNQTPFLDDDLLKVQGVHGVAVPRIGGVGVFIGLLAGMLLNVFIDPSKAGFIWMLILCSIPAFLIGLAEDILKNLSVTLRLILISLSGVLFIFLDGSVISSLGIVGDRFLLSIYFIAALLTIFAITGLTNAYNIIDGFNGLSSMVGIISLMAVAYVGFLVGDVQIPGACFAMIGGISGFFLWNYPRGLIFLGDCGSYLIGSWVSFLSILLVARHPNVSPWFAILVNAYPVFETLFSIYRRKLHRGVSAASPDGAHFHMLIYRRIVRLAGVTTEGSESQSFISNSKTSPYLWFVSSTAVMPAVLFWPNTLLLQLTFVLFCISYILMYRSLVRFKSPKWLRNVHK